MVIAEFQVGLALKGFASKLTVPNYRVKWGADFGPQKWMFCPKASAKHAQVWIFLGSNSLLGIHLSQQLKNFKIFYHLELLGEAFMESIFPKIGGLTVIIQPFCSMKANPTVWCRPNLWIRAMWLKNVYSWPMWVTVLCSIFLDGICSIFLVGICSTKNLSKTVCWKVFYRNFQDEVGICFTKVS